MHKKDSGLPLDTEDTGDFACADCCHDIIGSSAVLESI